jgi:hypothetical protein
MGEGAVADCAEAERTKRVCRPAVEVARGTDLRLALPESATPMRLRTLTADHGSTHLRCHDPPDDTSARHLVSLFKLPLSLPTPERIASLLVYHALLPVLDGPSRYKSLRRRKTAQYPILRSLILCLHGSRAIRPTVVN